MLITTGGFHAKPARFFHRSTAQFAVEPSQPRAEIMNRAVGLASFQERHENPTVTSGLAPIRAGREGTSPSI